LQSTKLIDISELNDIFGEMDNQETRETIESLRDDFLLKMTELSACIKEQDLDTFKLKSHSLKSNCCYLGAMQLNQYSYKLELSDSFNDDEFPSLWANFKSTFASTINEIDSTIKTLQLKDDAIE